MNIKSARQYICDYLASAAKRPIDILFVLILTALLSIARAGDQTQELNSSLPSTQTINPESLASYSDNAASLLNTDALEHARLPAAYLVSKDRLIELTCPEEPKLCSGKVAIFDKRYFYILLDESLASKQPEVLTSFIIHELVHVYQYFRPLVSVRNACNLHLQNEREAYRIQNRFLSDAGLHYNFGQELRGALCPVTVSND